MPVPPFDLDLLQMLNRPGTPWLDGVMLAASSRVVLGCAAIGCAVFVGLRSPQRWLAAAMLLAAVGITDLVCVRVAKPLVARERPCRADPSHVVAPTGCGSGQSFPSAHAANSAAAAAVLSWAYPWASPLAVLLTALVGVSRVYLGEHYPTDVLAGHALGVAVATALIFLARVRLAPRRR